MSLSVMHESETTTKIYFFFLISKEKFIYKETLKERLKVYNLCKVYKPIHPPPKEAKDKEETQQPKGPKTLQ